MVGWDKAPSRPLGQSSRCWCPKFPAVPRGFAFVPYVGRVSGVEEDPIHLPLPSKWLLSQKSHLCFGSGG